MKIDKELPLSRPVERTVRVETKIEPRHKAKIVEIAQQSGRSISNLVERWVLSALDAPDFVVTPNLTKRQSTDSRQEKLVGRRWKMSLRLSAGDASRLDVLAASKSLNRSAMVSDIVQTALRRPAKAVR